MMTFQAEWKSFQGSLTEDNRDYCGISERPDASLYMVVDGATSSPRGGDLAKALVHHIVDAFLSLDEISESSVCGLIRSAQHKLRYCHSADVASYLIVVEIDADELIVLHAGDCRLGQLEDCENIHWLTKPHTLANAIKELEEDELVSSQKRHTLTRCFKGRRFVQPDIGKLSTGEKDVLVMATDGFWADLLTSEKADFLSGKIGQINQDGDDKSVLVLCRTKGGSEDADNVSTASHQNLYTRSK